MTNQLPDSELRWLERFFATPNELSWSNLLDGSALVAGTDQVGQWLELLRVGQPNTPLVLPFVRNNKVSGWYAATNGPSGRAELGVDLTAWLGPTWLNRLDTLSKESLDPMAAILADRFGSPIYRLSGPDDAALLTITARLGVFATLLQRKPRISGRQGRPVGVIRSDFDRALIAGDEALAHEMSTELQQTGRLNEENRLYLEVRLNAGLGLWPEIARNQWLIRTIADVTPPPQVIADLIEALYRTYVDEVETSGDIVATRGVFAEQLAKPYPKLFASRRGIRSPRVVKAFLFFEQLQASPDAAIMSELLELLPIETRASLAKTPPFGEEAPRQTVMASGHEADEAFEDGQIDRAFEFYLRLPPSKKTISRLVICVRTIGTDNARDRLLALVDHADPFVVEELAPQITATIASLRHVEANSLDDCDVGDESPSNPWIAWSGQLMLGSDLVAVEREFREKSMNWDISEIRESTQMAQRFADEVGGLNGQASIVARAAVPRVFSSIFPDDSIPTVATKPVALLLFSLIAMDATLSSADLDLLAQLTILLISQGLTSNDYVDLMEDLADVQKKVGSYKYLPWSLDLVEGLAVLPCPSDDARESLLRLFLLILRQASGFAHRLVASDLVPIRALAKDYQLGPDAISGLERSEETEITAPTLPDLVGKTIGIYTLEEGAGDRARRALEQLFPGCNATVNSDTVATAQLATLARRSDIFVFAWKSSSHQALYCVKDAMRPREPIWPPGKGTASILLAVLGYLEQ